MAEKKKTTAKKKTAKAKEVDPTIQSSINQAKVLIEKHKAEIERLEAEISELS